MTASALQSGSMEGRVILRARCQGKGAGGFHPFTKEQKIAIVDMAGAGKHDGLGTVTMSARTRSSGNRPAGFTLVELMMVVSVLAVMASMAAPKFANTIQKAMEGTLKGNLGALRGALSIYYADNEGIHPSCVVEADSPVFQAALYPDYISPLPTVKSGLHPPTGKVYCDGAIVPGAVHDAQGWYYDGAVPPDADHGGVWVACDHTDSMGREWTTF